MSESTESIVGLGDFGVLTDSLQYLYGSASFSLISLTLLTLVVGYYSIVKKKDHATIPSLPLVPILGSLPFLSTLGKFHLFLTDKSQKYGSVFSFRIFSQYTIVLNGYEAIRDGLVKRSADYAGRGSMYAVDKVWTDPNKGILFREYGEPYRKLRKHGLLVLKAFGYGQQSVMEAKITAEIEHLTSYIRSRANEAWHPAHVLEFTSMNIIYNVMFSERFNYDDPMGQFLHKANKTMADSCEVIYDLLPIVTYLPNVWRYLSNVRNTYRKLIEVYEEKIEGCKINPTDRENFIQEYIKQVREQEFDKRELAVLLRDLILAGTETTSGQINWALIFMANNPDVQAKVQDAIDSVVPRDKLPSLDDRVKLPFVEATILEVMRLRTAVPLAAPHVTTADTQVLGHHVPANTTVIVNIWSAHMDPAYWPDTEKFNPERFLDANGKVQKRELVIPFSLGKRQCLGEVLAREEFFLIFSALMQQFIVLPPEDETKIKEEYNFIRALTAAPHLMRIIPR